MICMFWEKLVIALDKVAQGIYSTQITSSTSNFMVHTLKRSCK